MRVINWNKHHNYNPKSDIFKYMRMVEQQLDSNNNRHMMVSVVSYDCGNAIIFFWFSNQIVSFNLYCCSYFVK